MKNDRKKGQKANILAYLFTCEAQGKKATGGLWDGSDQGGCWCFLPEISSG